MCKHVQFYTNRESWCLQRASGSTLRRIYAHVGECVAVVVWLFWLYYVLYFCTDFLSWFCISSPPFSFLSYYFIDYSALTDAQRWCVQTQTGQTREWLFNSFHGCQIIICFAFYNTNKKIITQRTFTCQGELLFSQSTQKNEKGPATHAGSYASHRCKFESSVIITEHKTRIHIFILFERILCLCDDLRVIVCFDVQIK